MPISREFLVIAALLLGGAAAEGTHGVFLGGANGTQTVTWDGRRRLACVQERAEDNDGYDWTAIYDGLGRRLRTVCTAVTNGVAVADAAQTIDSIYDPQVEFLEVAASVSEPSGSKTYWKIHGPDLNGAFGGLQGIGGLDGILDQDTGDVTGIVNDFFGNCVGWIDTPGGALTWNPCRVNGYGAAPLHYQKPFGSGISLAEATLWRSRRIDPTGLFWLGERYYEPHGGRFLSPDPLGHAASWSLYDYAGGDPVNSLDADGRIRAGFNAGGHFASRLWEGIGSGHRPGWYYDSSGQQIVDWGNGLAFSTGFSSSANAAQTAGFLFGTLTAGVLGGGSTALHGLLGLIQTGKEEVGSRVGIDPAAADFALAMVAPELMMRPQLPMPRFSLGLDLGVETLESGAPAAKTTAPTVDRIRQVAQQGYDYAVQNPRVPGLNRMGLGKDAEIQATRWTRRWAERNGVDLGPGGLQFQVRGANSIPDMFYDPATQIFDFKLTPKAFKPAQHQNFQTDFPGYGIDYIYGP